MDQFPSGSAPIELDKEFCVKNIPANFVDWDLFHVFRRYGTVHNVKIPSKQLQSNTKYGFVIMENMNGADEVRSQLRSGKYLNLDNGLQLLVRVVESPFPCKSVSEGFVFHAIPIDQKLGDEYSCLQREMNKFCARNPNVNEIPKVGQYVLYCRDTIAFRALCNTESTLYLIDIGEVIPIIRSHMWELIPSFTTLPSLVLKQWSRGCPGGLIATAQEYSGLINMVHLQVTSDKGVEENFASLIAQKGLCTCLSHDLRVYSREDLLEAKNSKVC
ncbi:hypothetical protein TELCIR_11359 [Teladorsagia circumcincta]|uniref:RRM domain-containing protein n=1 Tax=Teladorsagia circumcincta TaxID=45464 RepID=A0A2G9U9K9_TELCI|nr:hypothetical protein TELCIR_11359 [Teladorsagia circumcincta]